MTFWFILQYLQGGEAADHPSPNPCLLQPRQGTRHRMWPDFSAALIPENRLLFYVARVRLWHNTENDVGHCLHTRHASQDFWLTISKCNIPLVIPSTWQTWWGGNSSQLMVAWLPTNLLMQSNNCLCEKKGYQKSKSRRQHPITRHCKQPGSEAYEWENKDSVTRYWYSQGGYSQYSWRGVRRSFISQTQKNTRAWKFHPKKYLVTKFSTRKNTRLKYINTDLFNQTDFNT